MRACYAGIVVGLLAGPALADGLTQAEAVERVLARHPAVAAGRYRVEAAEQGRGRAGAAWLPQVQVTARGGAHGPVPTLHIDTGLTLPGQTTSVAIDRELGQTWTADAQLRVAWRALDFGARTARQQAARAGVDATRAQAQTQTVEVAWAVRQTYAAAQFFADVVAVEERAEAMARRDLASAEARRKAGTGAKVAVAAARSRLADVRAARAEAEAGLERARAVLRLLLGLPDEAPVVLSDELEALANAPIPGPPEATPAEEAARAAARAKRAMARAAGRSWWPTVDLVASGGFAVPRTFVETQAGLTWQAGVVLRWPVFDGGLRKHERAQLIAEAAALDKQARAVAEDRARVRAEAAARLTAARKAVRAAEERVEAAQTWLAAARSALEAGTATALEVERAAVRLDAARLAITRAYFAAARARADFLKALGIAGEPTP